MPETVVLDPSVSDQPDLGARSDWRLGFGVSATLVWLALGFWYISTIVGWSEFVEQNAPSLGSFLEGAFAPLAFLWLVVGFFLQQRQLMENTEAVKAQYLEMRRSAEQAEIQSQAILDNERHIRQNLFIKTLETVKEQLGVIAGFLCLSYDQESPGRVLGEESSEMWRQFSTGDPALFSRRALTFYYENPDLQTDFFFGSEIRSRHSRRFIEVFEKLEAAGEDSDPRGFLVEALRDTTHGRLYRCLLEEDPSTVK